MAKDSSGPAFPQENTAGPGKKSNAHPGMSLRDWFAGQALQGLLAHDGDEAKLSETAKRAYSIADALIKHRDTGGDKTQKGRASVEY